MQNLIKNKFRMIFNGDPELEKLQLDIMAVNLPDVTVSTVSVSKRGSIKSKRAGDDIDFSTLDITFKLDDKLDNYVTILDWLYTLCDPQDGKYADKSIHASLLLMHSNGSLIRELVFYNLFPSNISTQTVFATNDPDTEYQEAIVTFQFDWFKVK